MVVDCIGYGPGDIRQDLRAFARRAGRLVFISTDFVYDPERRRFPQPEDTEHYLPPGGYGGDKRLAELELAANAGGLAWTVLRPCHIYGPGSELGCLPLHGRDPQLVAAIRGGRPLRLVGGGRFLQQPIFARDLARLILSVPAGDRSRNAVFNTAGPDLIESREFYRIVAEILGCAVSFEEVPIGAFFQENPGKASFLCHRIYGHDRLRQAGLCVPATPIRQGLTEHVEWILRRDAAEGR
jgi:nucleoside-diphosphate-sugar epimerase